MEYTTLTPQQNEILRRANNFRSTFETEIPQFQSWHGSKRLEIERLAEEDAGRNLPNNTTPCNSAGLTPQEEAIRSDYANRLNSLLSDGVQLLKQLKSNFGTTYRDYIHNENRVISRLKDEASQQRQIEVNNEKARHIQEELDIKLEVANKQRGYDKAKERFAPFAKQFGRTATDGNIYLLYNKWVDYLIIFLLALFELPLNHKVFELFGDNEIMTYLMAFFVCFLMVWMAHLAGIGLKRRKEGLNAVFAGLGILALVGAAFMLSILRAYLLELPLDEEPALGDISMSNYLGNVDFLVNFFINLVILLVGIVLGYYSVDSSKIFQDEWKVLNDAEKKWIQERAGFDQKESAEDHRHQAANAAANKKEEEANQQIPQKIADGKAIYTDYCGLYNGIRELLMKLETTVEDGMEETANKYRAENMRLRKDTNALPVCWSSARVAISLYDDKTEYIRAKYEEAE